MNKWEYMLVELDERRVRCINRDEDPERKIYITDFINKAGAKGWEAVNMFNVVNQYGVVTSEHILFKRELN